MRLRPLFLLTMSMVAGCLVTGTALAALTDVKINEIRIDQPGSDVSEYFELTGPDGQDLTGLTYVVIGDGAGGSGVVDFALDLTGLTISGGFFLAAEGTFALGATPDLVTSLNFENSDNVTHMLVTGWTGTVGADLDTTNDCTLDITPWTSVVDLIALVEEPNPPVFTECHYGPPSIGPDGSFVPGHVYKCPDTADWAIGPFDPASGLDTPGAPNPNCLAAPPSVVSEARVPCVPDPGFGVTISVCALNADSAYVSYTLNGGAATVIDMPVSSTNVDTTCFSVALPAMGGNADLVEYQVTVVNANGQINGGTQGYFVGLTPISRARVNDSLGINIYQGYGIKIRGNVTAEYGTFSSTRTDGYIQDATSGINVFEFDLHPVWQAAARGDELEIIGNLDQFSGKLEISTTDGVCDTLLIENLGPGAVPTPLDIFPCGLNEDREGMLVKMFYAAVDTTNPDSLLCTPGIWCGSQNYRITNCAAASTHDVHIDGDSNIPGNPIVSTQYVVTGIVSQFGGVQARHDILPRDLTDLVPVNVTVGVGDGVEPPTMKLLQNHPNPFSRFTQIRYQVPRGGAADGKSRVTLRVFDIQGRRVATVVDGILDPGEYEVTLDASTLGDVSPGVYFYSLEVNGKKQTRKLLLKP